MVVKPAGTFLKAIALLSMLIPGVLMAETTAKLDRETIYLDQTVRLVIETDQNESANYKPDLSALEANFNILGSSSSQNISYVNGTQTSLKSWLTELEPKAAGSYTIPAVAVGNERTNALRLTVLPVDNSATSSNRDIYVELEAEGSRFYVQQQINLTIRLYLGVNLIDGTLSEPEPVDAIVRRLGTDAQFQTSRGNRTYRVVERKYAIFPSRSGRLEIPPIQFQGIARDSGDNSSQLFSGLLNQGKRLRSKSSGLTLEISPPNPSFDGKTWLPAHRIVISEGQSPPDEIVLGQPFTWQIGIQAEGLNADQLPAIQLVEDENFKLYPDKQTRNTTDDGVMVTGHVTRNLAMIANKEGEFHLPDLEIIWWNTESDTQETARLPGKRLRVTPGQEVSNEHIPASDISNGSETSASRDIQPALLSNEPGSVMRYFWPSLCLLLLTGWILSLVYFNRKLNNQVSNHESKKALADSSSLNFYPELIKACRSSDAVMASRMLWKWKNALKPNDFPGLLTGSLTSTQNEKLLIEIKRLNNHLYANPDVTTHTRDWSGKNLEQALNAFSNQVLQDQKKSNSDLPELYPG